MTVAIVHYHLGPGGVPHVIATASRALKEAGVPHVILVGEAPDATAEELPVRRVPELNYRTSTGRLSPREVTDRLRASAFEALGQAPDIWHFHNHSLGKNPLVPEIVARLAAENENIVLQIHDLAEDGRPENHQVIAGAQNLYPFSSRVHYVFLNTRDFTRFTEAGLPVENASVIANPVPLKPRRPRDEAGTQPPLLFAPVRGIRRKNLGELAFLAALAPPEARFAVSRAPLNPEALSIHDAWCRFAKRHRLPIEFNVVDRLPPAAGASADFDSWLAHATHFVSASVAEGFGLPFLEAIALGKPLIARNLPHITADHARHGIRTGHLYDRLLVPADWIDLTILRDHLKTTLGRNHRAYRRPLSNETSAAAFAALLHDGWLDFGNLPEPLQQGVIERVADPACRKIPLARMRGQTETAEDWLAAAIANRKPAANPDQLAPFSPARYVETITALYSAIACRPSTPVHNLSAGAILTAHLRPQSFHFLLSALKPKPTPCIRHRAVIFDIYGTLLIAPPSGVKPDPAADPVLRRILLEFGHQPPQSPSRELHAAVLRHHAAAGVPFPEIDLRLLWREVLSLDAGTNTSPLVAALEAAWHPTRPMPGAENIISQLARAGVSLGILSNAQSNTLSSLGSISDLFAPELTILSYQHGIAKPAPELFHILTDRLAGRGITPEETLFVGNDPLQDITPAAAHGFKTALFTGHPDSLRAGTCVPDFKIRHWSELAAPGSADMRDE